MKSEKNSSKTVNIQNYRKFSDQYISDKFYETWREEDRVEGGDGWWWWWSRSAKSGAKIAKHTHHCQNCVALHLYYICITFVSHFHIIFNAKIAKYTHHCQQLCVQLCGATFVLGL